jgi:hypothetical protein
MITYQTAGEQVIRAKDHKCDIDGEREPTLGNLSLGLRMALFPIYHEAM